MTEEPLPQFASCSACGAGIQPEYRYCPACGAVQLESDKTDQPGERRQVTILFADLTDFTGLSNTMDAEDLRDLIEAYFDRLDPIVARHGGTVDKHIGDAVMALFGAPVAHADDPERAVRAAFDMHAAMAAMSAEMGRPLSVHVGIAAGSVVAGTLGRGARREYTVLGRAVNLAARLNDMAEAQQTLISDDVRRATEGMVVCRSAGSVRVKGYDAPVDVWRAETLAADRDAARTAFVGREAELARIDAVIETCTERGGGAVVTISGDAGIGKSRLLEEMLSRAGTAGLTLAAGRVGDHGLDRGRDAIAALAAALLRGGDDRLAALDRAVDDGLLRRGDAFFLYDLLGLQRPEDAEAVWQVMDHAGRMKATGNALAALVTAAAGRGPLCLALDDVHWAGPTAQGLTETLIDLAGQLPLVLALVARRADGSESAQHLSIPDGIAHEEIALAPMAENEAAALIEAEPVTLNAAARAACLDRAGGNPLYLKQFARAAAGGDLAALPASIHSLILSRVDRLADGDKRAMQAAAVLRDAFGVDALRSVADLADFDPAALIEETLLRAEGGRLSFPHAVIREGVYESMLKRTRTGLHRRAADWYADRDPTLYAQHLDRAGAKEAAGAYLAAARAMAEAERPEAALALASRGRVLAASDGEKVALGLVQGQCARDLGRIAEALAAYQDAAAIAPAGATRCAAYLGCAGAQRIQDQNEAALTSLDQAEFCAKTPAARAQIKIMRGNIHFARGQLEDCLAAHRAGLALAEEARSAEDQARALGGMGDAYYALGQMRTSNLQFERCVALARERDLRRAELANLSMLGHTKRYLNDLEGAHRDSAAAAAAAERSQQHRAEMVARRIDCDILFELGRLDEARDELERSLAIARRLGSPRFEALLGVFDAKLHGAAGDPATGLALLDHAATISRETGSRFSGPIIQGAIAVLTDDDAVRARALAEGESQLPGAVSHNHFWFCRDAIDASLAAGDWQAALRYADAFEDYVAEEPLPLSTLFIARARALATLVRPEIGPEERVRARKALDDVLAEARHAGFWTALSGVEGLLARAGS